MPRQCPTMPASGVLANLYRTRDNDVGPDVGILATSTYQEPHTSPDPTGLSPVTSQRRLRGTGNEDVAFENADALDRIFSRKSEGGLGSGTAAISLRIACVGTST